MYRLTLFLKGRKLQLIVETRERERRKKEETNLKEEETNLKEEETNLRERKK